MELEFPLTFMLLVSSFFIILKLLHKSSASSRLLDRIPGPKKLPVIGNLHLLAGNPLPHRAIAELAAKYGPLMRLQLGAVPFVIVSSVEIANEVLKTHDIAFANRPTAHAMTTITYNNRDIGNSPYGEYWRQLKKICTTEMLSARRVKSFRPVREKVNSKLAEWIASNEGSPVNLSARLSAALFETISRASVGEVTESRALTSAIKDVSEFASIFYVADLYPSNRLLPVITGMKFKLQRIFRKSDRVLQRIIDDHRASKATRRSEDLVDVLLKYEEDEAEVHLTDDSIKAVIMDMFIAGADTSAVVATWAMSEMMRNPTTMEKARDEVRRVMDGKGCVDDEKLDELKYVKLVIKETLRLHMPGPILIPRVNNDNCVINGYEIPAKTRVAVNTFALARDPKYWKEAEKFVPERFEDSSIDFRGNNPELLPFGAGRRICPGILFALTSVEFTLATLLYHFDWRMPDGMKNEELDMSEIQGTTLSRKTDLLLIPTLKRPLV